MSPTALHTRASVTVTGSVWFSTDTHTLRFYECKSNFWCIFYIRTFLVISLDLMVRFFRDLKVMKWGVHLNFLYNLLRSISKLDLESQISSMPHCLEG